MRYHVAHQQQTQCALRALRQSATLGRDVKVVLMTIEQLQHLILYGAIHALSLSLVTEYFKKIFKIGDMAQRWLPLLMAFPSTLVFLPIALKAVGVTMELTIRESIGAWISASVLAASTSKIVYDVARLVKNDVIKAIQNRIKNMGGKS